MRSFVPLRAAEKTMPAAPNIVVIAANVAAEYSAGANLRWEFGKIIGNCLKPATFNFARAATERQRL